MTKRMPGLPLLLVMLCVGSTTASGATPPAGGDAKEPNDARVGEISRVDQAREALLKRLKRAEEDGFVALSDQDKPAESKLRSNREAASPRQIEEGADAVIEKSHGLDIENNKACLSPELFTSALADLGDDPLASIALLKSQWLDDGLQHRAEVTKRLALSYLAIGFMDEAAAVAESARENDPVTDAIFAFSVYPKGNATSRLSPCGSLERLMIGPESGVDYSPLSEADMITLKQLPPAMTASLVERYVLAAADHSDRTSLSRLRLLSADIVDMEMSDAFEFAELAAKVTEEPASDSLKAMIEIAETPGTHQERAVETLIAASNLRTGSQTEIADALEEASIQALDANTRSKAGLTAGKARIGAGKIGGGLSLLSRALGAHSDSAGEANEILAGALNETLRQSDKNRKIQALTAIAEKPDVLLVSLDNQAVELVARQFAAWGAVREVENLDLGGRLGDREADYWMITALLNAGDLERAKSISLARIDDPKFVERVYSTAIRLGDDGLAKRAVNTAALAGNAELVARAAWRSGDWQTATTAYSAALRNKPSDDEAFTLALSALAEKKREAPPAAVSEISDVNTRRAVLHLFNSAPVHSELPVYRAFSSGVAEEISLIRARLSYD